MDLFIEQKSWKERVLGLVRPRPEKADSVSIAQAPVLSLPSLPVPHHPVNGFGECQQCHKERRLWAGICGWCGAAPEDFEE